MTLVLSPFIEVHPHKLATAVWFIFSVEFLLTVWLKLISVKFCNIIQFVLGVSHKALLWKLNTLFLTQKYTRLQQCALTHNNQDSGTWDYKICSPSNNPKTFCGMTRGTSASLKENLFAPDQPLYRVGVVMWRGSELCPTGTEMQANNPVQMEEKLHFCMFMNGWRKMEKGVGITMAYTYQQPVIVTTIMGAGRRLQLGGTGGEIPLIDTMTCETKK